MVIADEPSYLCLDQGGSASRALVFDRRGRCLSSARREVAHQRPRPGWVEQSPDAVVDSLREVAAEALARLDARQRDTVQASGLVCQRSSLLAWDRYSGKPLTPVLSWQDVRAADWLSAQNLDAESIHARTGLYPNAHFGLSKLRWLLDEDAAVQAARRAGRLCFGPLASFLARQLLRERPTSVDPCNASRTLLLDLGASQWSEDRLDTFGIAPDWLPTIAPCDTLRGHLDIDATALPMRLLSGDQSAAAFAFGAPKVDMAYANLGTGAFIYRPTNTPVRLPRLLCSLIHEGREQRHFAVEGTVNGAGSALAWFASTHGVGDIENLLADSWSEDPPVFLNGIGGLGSPDWRAGFPSRFIGEGSAGARAVAVAESIVFLLARNLRCLQSLPGHCAELRISGGLTGADPLCQRISDVTGLVLRRPAHCEASARGSGFLLAGEDADWQALPDRVFEPNPAPALLERHAAWQAAMADALESS